MFSTVILLNLCRITQRRMAVTWLPTPSLFSLIMPAIGLNLVTLVTQRPPVL
jgi:hypothetical protein